MKPIFLCMCDEYNDILKKYTKVSLSSCQNIGVSKEFKGPDELLKSMEEDGSLDKELSKILNKALNNKSKIHIVGDTSNDIDKLNLILSFFDKKKFKKTSLHLIAKKFERKALLVDEFKYEKLFPKKTYKVDKNDIIIFFNVNLDNFKSVVATLKKEKRQIKTFISNGNDSIIKMPKCDCLGSILDSRSLKQLRCNIDNYTFDGYQNIKYEHLKSIKGDIFNEVLTNYDLIVANVDKKDFEETFDYIKDRTIFLIITKKDGKDILISNQKELVSSASQSDIMPTILELLGIETKEKTLFIKENKYLIMFEVISILFIISCIVYYMARLLHFYLMK